MKGVGNQQDYGMRIYDPRIGKFLSVDPLTKTYPWYSPYQFAGNNPIKYVDMDGGEPGYTYVDDRGIVVTVPAGDNLQRPVPPEHLRYLPDGSAGGWRNWASEFAVGVGAPLAIVADASTGFTVTRTVGTVLTAATVMNLYSNMHISGNAKDPIVKQEHEMQAKQDAAELVMMWGGGRLLKEAGQVIKPAPLILSKGSRLKLFYEKINVATPVGNPKDVIKLVNSSLDEIEDAYSGVKKAKGIPDRDDGRMYGILDDKYITKL